MRKEKFALLILNLIVSFCIAQVDTSAYSLYMVHSKVLSVSCALPACHDGSFEPDFRTIESAFNTLVYHPVIKNNNRQNFKYRVVPYQPASSVLFERITNCCFVNTNDRMPFTVGDTLSRSEIALIKNWILNGARDLCGNEPVAIITPVSVRPIYNSYRSDTICISGQNNRIDKLTYKPFLVSSKLKKIRLEFQISTSNLERIRHLTNSVLCISTSMDDFTNARCFKLTYRAEHLETEVDPSVFSKNVPHYLQVKFLDELARKQVIFPDGDTETHKKIFWSFVIRD